jgi:hypothetical protein
LYFFFVFKFLLPFFLFFLLQVVNG